MRRALLRSLGKRPAGIRSRKPLAYRSFSTKFVGSTDAVWRQHTRDVLASKDRAYQPHDIQSILTWWCRIRSVESASIVWKLFDLNPDPKIRSVVLDHWRWCIKLSIPVEEDCSEVWSRWLRDSSLAGREYSIFLAALGATDRKEGVIELAHEVLDHYKLQHAAGLEHETVVWNSVLAVHAKQATGSETADAALQLLRQIPAPNNRSYSIAMEAVVKTASEDDTAADTAADLFAQMKPSSDRVAVTYGFVHLLRTHCKSQRLDGAMLASELLNGAVEDYLQLPDFDGPVPNKDAFAAVLAGFCQRNDFSMASGVLQQLQGLYQRTGGDHQFELTVKTFNKILDAAPYLELLRSYETPDVVSYNTVLNHLRKSEDSETETLCVDLLEEMKGRGIVPDTASFTAVLQALTDPNVAEQVYQDFLMTTARNPTVTIFNAMMSVWARARLNRPEAPVRVQMYFDQLRGQFISTKGRVQPTRKSYSALLKCLSTNGAACSRVLNIMYEDLLHHKNAHARPDRRVFHSVMQAWKQSGNPEKAVYKIEELLRQMQHEHKARRWDVRPNRGSFLILLKTLAQIGTEASAERAESILQYMHRERDPHVDPDSMCYGKVMEAWFRAGSNHSLRAQTLFQEILRRWHDGDQKFKPHAFTYGVMLKVWASSPHPQAGIKADEIFQQMKNRTDGEAEPGVWHVTTLMDAYAQTGNVERVCELMENELKVPPERVHFNQLLKAYARSSDIQDAPEKAAAVVDLMQDTQTPNTITYTTFLKVLQNSQRPDAYENSKQVVKGMLELAKSGETGATPSAATWTTLLETLLKTPHLSNETKRLEVAWMEPYILENDEDREKFKTTRYWIQRIQGLSEEVTVHKS